MGLKKKDIFYDEWHSVLINGPSGDTSLRKIYIETPLKVVFLSEEYDRSNWTKNIEWDSIKQDINNGKGNRIFILGLLEDPKTLDKFDGLSAFKTIYLDIRGKEPKYIAEKIMEKYRMLISESSGIGDRPTNTIIAKFTLPSINEFYNMEIFFQFHVLNRMIALSNAGMVDYYNMTEEMLSWLSSLDSERLDESVAKKVEEADTIIGWEKYQYLYEVNNGD